MTTFLPNDRPRFGLNNRLKSLLSGVALWGLLGLMSGIVGVEASAQTITITGTPQTAANVSRGFRNRLLYLFRVDVSGPAAILTGLTGFTTTGTYTSSDLNASVSPTRGLRVYYYPASAYASNLNSIETAGSGNTASVTDNSITGAGETLTFAPLNLTLATGTHYFTVVADLADAATVGRTIGLAGLTEAAFQFSGSPTVNPATFPATGLQTIGSGTLTIRSNGTPGAANVERGITNLPLYRFALTATGAATSFCNSTAGPAVVVAGTYSAASAAGNLRMVYSVDSTLDAYDQQLGGATTLPATTSTSTVNLNSVSITIPEGTTRYVFITTNIPAGAVVGDNLSLRLSTATVPIGTTLVNNATTGGLQTLVGASPLTLTGTAPVAGTVLQGVSDVLLTRVQADVSATTVLTQFQFTPGGTYTVNDVSSFKLYYSTSPVFSPASARLLKTQTATTAGLFTFTSSASLGQTVPTPNTAIYQLLTPGVPHYFFVTTDIKPTATPGKTIKGSYSSANGSATATLLAGGTRTINAVTASDLEIATNAQIALSSPLPAALNLPQGSSNAVLYQLQTSVTSTNAQFTGLTLSVTVTNPADIAGGYRLYYSTDASLDTGIDPLIGSAISATATSQALLFQPATPIPIAAGLSGYFFLVVNTIPEAVLGNQIRINAPSLTDVSFSSGILTGTLTAVTHTNSGPPNVVLNSLGGFPTEVAKGTRQVLLYGLSVAVSGAGTQLTGITLRTATGGFSAADISGGYRLYRSADNQFDVLLDTPVGEAIAATGSGQTLVFTPASPISIALGETIYFFLVTDLASNATVGNHVQIQPVGLADVTFTLSINSGTPTAGPAITIVDPPAINVTAVGPTSGTIVAGATDVVLYGLQMAVSGAYANLKRASFRTGTGFRPADINGGYRLYYSADAVFQPATDVPLGTLISASNTPQRLDFDLNLPIRLEPSTTGYLLLVTNLSAFATAGHTVSIAAPLLSDIQFETATLTGNPATGGVFTVAAPAPDLTGFPFPNHPKVLNITQPPYNADPTGVVDATAAFNAAVASSMSFVYIPNGTYRLTDAITWQPTLVPDVRGRGGSGIQLWGQSRDGVILKLDNNAPGFGDPANPKPLIFTGEDQPNRFGNSIANLTIHTGTGNAGAIALRYYANNFGMLDNVLIKSGDGQGIIGLDQSYSRANGPNFVKNLTIDGFNVGIKTDFALESNVFEHITLKNQTQYGFYNGKQVLSIRDLKTTGQGELPFTMSRVMSY
ncbi:hypothetical protein GO730_21865 [Spirosoma sp. HMF3257]|uniref:Rhamnogalacturonase A/B/Epimerase-like pectate lyase domain-containing protein n=1 Tax=Spirosoma telluris TaxID=2183553 RepID=A0A327NP16_9BACT|nr:hypothetical protein [Spirosoma telluris]RAI76159.1 hypothetical protein HMF3257_21790 [Spirosoma telluris]